MKRWKISVGVFLVLVLCATFLYATSGTYRQYILGKLMTIGDILYADQADRLTNLNAGALGTILQSAGPATAPAYVAKNIFRRATVHNFATSASSWTLSSDEALCLYLIGSNAANSACTVQVGSSPTDGTIYVVRNASGQNMTLHSAGGTGITVATAKTAILIYSSGAADFYRVTADQTH